MIKFAEEFSELLSQAIKGNIHEAMEFPVEDISDEIFVSSETIGEVVDKLIILHIRIWHLEDQVVSADSKGLIEIERKLRHCFKVKRPRLVVALDRLITALAKGHRDVADSLYVKSYAGIE